jgi:hypothetical protein
VDLTAKRKLALNKPVEFLKKELNRFVQAHENPLLKTFAQPQRTPLRCGLKISPFK